MIRSIWYLVLCFCFSLSAENASLVCDNGDVRLFGGGAPYEGLVEVCFNGIWGSVCHDDWDTPDALTVCRILGYGESDLAIPTRANFFQVIDVAPPSRSLIQTLENKSTSVFSTLALNEATPPFACT